MAGREASCYKNHCQITENCKSRDPIAKLDGKLGYCIENQINPNR